MEDPKPYVSGFSSVLAMIGSLLVIFTWAYPKQNRVKPGRILLFWLSVADFLSSFFYFLSAFDSLKNKYCTQLALITIFFPIASFIWTDIIAFYLYLVVKNRSSKMPYNWKYLLIFFHILSWGLSGLFIAIVGFSGKAGGIDDDQVSNTGGWCWIKYQGNKTDTFIWELVGGKLVEWISGIIIVPVLYMSVARELYRIEKNFTFRLSALLPLGRASLPALPETMKKSPSQPSLKSEGDAIRNVFHTPEMRNVVSDNASERSESGADNVEKGARAVMMVKTGKSSNSTTTGRTDTVIQSNNRSESSEGISDGEYLSNQLFSSARDYDGYDSTRSFQSGSQPSFGQYYEEEEIEEEVDTKSTKPPISKVAQDRMTQRTSSSQSNSKYFTKFYLKLALLPLVFIFIRFWGSLNIILTVTNADSSETITYLQTFFDPSQGFFNAILFVLFSKSDRNELVNNVRTFWNQVCCYYCYGKKSSGGIVQDLESNSKTFEDEGLATTNQLRDKLLQHQSIDNVVLSNNKKKADDESYDSNDAMLENRSHGEDEGEFIDIAELDEDFECMDENRLSNFSFDSRMESIPAPVANLPNFDTPIRGVIPVAATAQKK